MAIKLTNEQIASLHSKSGIYPKAFSSWLESREKIQAHARIKKENEIEIYGLIISEAEASFHRMVGDESFMTASKFKRLLPDKGEVTLRINSDGGDAFEASAISQMIQERGNVKCMIDGIAASAASIISTVCTDVTIAEMGQIMIHRASSWMWGNAEELMKTADFLKKIDKSAAELYGKRMNIDEKEILKKMSETTFYDSKEAVEAGLADRVYKDDQKDFKQLRDAKVKQSLETLMFNFSM